MLSGKDILFGVVIFSLVIVFSVFIPSNKVLVTFDENAVDIKSSKYTMNIPYEMVNNIELTDLPEPGKEIDGHDDMILLTGTWENDTWGEYHACIELASEKCIVVHLDDGRIFVFSRRDAEETESVYNEFETYLPSEAKK